MRGLIHYHPAIVSLIGYYLFSAAVSSLPAPIAQSGRFYVWFFRFSNSVAANLSRAYSTAVEGSPNFAVAAKLLGEKP